MTSHGDGEVSSRYQRQGLKAVTNSELTCSNAGIAGERFVRREDGVENEIRPEKKGV
jgi:hypothetical protein